jgi:deoxyribonuclease IV
MNKIGCHVSIAKGLWNAPANAAALGCEAFQIFSRSPHGGPVAPITPDTVEKFQTAMKEYGFDEFVIHAPYIMNFGSANPRVYHGSVSILRGELERGSLIGASYVMFHPGSISSNPDNGLKQAKEGFKKVLDGYEGSTKLLIENTAGAGQVLGDTFEELADLMKPLLKYKGFGGVCYDTQHGFGSGYDLRSSEAVEKTFLEFDKFIGLKWLKMFQVNDSKVALGSHKDRHEHIEDGLIGKAGFTALLRFLKAKRLDIPLIFETNHDKVEADIKILKTLRDKA